MARGGPQILKKSQFTEALYSSYTKVLTFENVWQVNPAGQWALDDVDALEQPAGEASNSFGGRSAVEQRLIYGEDPFSLGHPVDGETDNVEGLGDVRLKVHNFSEVLTQ